MNAFKEGQRVRVEFEGVVGDHPIRVKGHNVAVVRDNGFTHSVRPEDIHLADPKDWPPQVGDIWHGNGMEWFARKNPYSENMFLAPVNGEDDWTQQEFKALNPVLARRRSQ